MVRLTGPLALAASLALLSACSDNNEAAVAPMGGEGYQDPNAPTHSGVASTAPTLGEPADPDRKPPNVSQSSANPESGQSPNAQGGTEGTGKSDDREGSGAPEPGVLTP